MGQKRPSQRTLDSGEIVIHEPPDDLHPEGKLTLVRNGSPLRERLDAVIEDNQRRHDDIKQVHADRIAVKQQSQADKGLPPEKSVV